MTPSRIEPIRLRLEPEKAADEAEHAANDPHHEQGFDHLLGHDELHHLVSLEHDPASSGDTSPAVP